MIAWLATQESIRLIAFLGDLGVLLWFFYPLESRGKHREIIGLLFLLPFAAFYDLVDPSFSDFAQLIITTCGEFTFLVTRASIRIGWVYLFLRLTKCEKKTDCLILATFFEMLYTSANIRSGIFKIHEISIFFKHFTNLFTIFICCLFVLVIHRFVGIERLKGKRARFLLFPTAGICWVAFIRSVLININYIEVSRSQAIGVFIFSLASILLFLLLYVTIEWNQKILEERYKREREHQELLYEMQNLERTIKHNGDVRHLYHDMKHHLQLLQILSKEDGKVKEYLDTLLEEVEIVGRTIETGNKTVNIVVAEKISIGNTRDIRFNIYLNLQNLAHIPPADLVTIWGNALDNAIEAVEKLPEPDERIIYIKSELYGNATLIRFSNPYADDIIIKNGKIITSKEDNIYHGIGLKSIEKCVAKWSGAVNVHIDKTEKLFVLTLLLPFPSEFFEQK